MTDKCRLTAPGDLEGDGLRPEVFADKSIVVGPGGGPLQFTTDLTNVKTAQLEQMRKWLTDAGGEDVIDVDG